MTKPYELFSMRIDPPRREMFRRAGVVFKDKRGKVPPKAKIVEKGLRALQGLADYEASLPRTILENILGTPDYLTFRTNTTKVKKQNALARNDTQPVRE